MKKICFKYYDITFRKTNEEDLSYVLALEKKPENSPLIRQWKEESHKSAINSNNYYHIIVEYKNQKAGYIILSGLNSIDRNIELTRIVIDKKDIGIGRKSIKALKALVFEELHAHRLWLNVRMKNEKAKYLYKSEGFVEEGILRDFILYENCYEPIIIFSILENEYSKITFNNVTLILNGTLYGI
ncbi:MAG: GNAT family N-acetyltransferase [Ruminiclostridium sp.]|nr:GNAT family N-acetyltransferase [Ruminiclostridium sp.]